MIREMELFQRNIENRNIVRPGKFVLISEKMSTGTVWDYTYNNEGNLIREARSDGYYKTYQYSNNKLMRTETSTGEWEKLTYNKHKLTKKEDSDGNTLKFIYRKNGKLDHKSLYHKGVLNTLWVYNNNANVTLYREYGSSGIISYWEIQRYDDSGNMIESIDSNDSKTNFVYGNNGKLLEIHFSYKNSFEQYEYDDNGNLLQIIEINAKNTDIRKCLQRFIYNTDGTLDLAEKIGYMVETFSYYPNKSVKRCTHTDDYGTCILLFDEFGNCIECRNIENGLVIERTYEFIELNKTSDAE